MAKNTKVLTVLSTAAVTGLITAALGSTAFAKTSAILVQNGSNDYKYDYSSLASAFEDYSANPANGALYQDYLKQLGGKSPVALYDNVQKTYIDYTKVASAFEDAQATTKPFDLNAFTETSKDTYAPAAPISDVTVGSDGKIVVTPEQAPVTNLAVSSVSATNYKEIAVTFNNTVDKTTAETVSNYVIGGGEPGTTTVASASLQADGKTVILTVNNKLTKQAADTLTVSGVNDTNGNTITSVTTNFVPLDRDLPVALSAKVIGPTTLRVTFSEPIDSALPISFVLDNNTYYVGSATPVAGDTHSFDVTFGTQLPVGAHTLGVTAATDYAGFSVDSSTKLTFNYALDTTALSASIASASQNQVVVKFNKPVTAATQGYVSIYHTYNNTSGYAPVSTTWSADGTTLTATFLDNYLPIGNDTIYVNAGTGTSIAKDAWGNAFTSTSFSATVSADTTAPVVSGVKVIDASHIDVTYSKIVTGATSPSNYTLKDSSGNAVYVLSAVQDGTNAKLYHLTTPSMVGGAYSLAIAGIKDISVAKNALTPVTVPITVPDKSAPTALSAAVTTDGKKVIVKFSKQVAVTGAYSALDANKYQINGTYVSSVSGATVSLGSDGKSVIITYPTSIGSLSSAYVGQVADLAGNISAIQTSSLTVGNDDITVANDVSNVKAVAKNQIQFDVDQQLSGLTVGSFSLSVGGSPVSVSSATYVNGAGKSTVTVTTSGNLPADLSGTNVLSIAGNGLTNILGTKNSAPLNITLSASNDLIAPTLLSATTKDIDHNGKIDTVTLTFDENLYAPSVNDSDFVVEGHTIKQVSVGSNTVVITLNEAGSPDSKTTPKVTLVGAVQDVARNTATINQSVTSTVGVDVASEKAAQVASVIAGSTVTGTVATGFTVTIPTSADTATLQSLLGNVTSTVATDMGGSITIGSDTITIPTTGVTTPIADTIAQKLTGNTSATAATTKLSDVLGKTITIKGVNYTLAAI